MCLLTSRGSDLKHQPIYVLDLMRGKSAYVRNVDFEEIVFISDTFTKYSMHIVSGKKLHHKYSKIYLISTLPSKRKIRRIA